MSKYKNVILFLLLPPLIALGVLYGVERKFNAQLRAELYNYYKNEQGVSKDSFAGVTGAKFCAYQENVAAAPSFCRDVKIVSVTEKAALAVIIVSILYILFVAVIGRKSRNRRDALLRLFSPGLYITALFTVLVTIANAAVLLAAIFYGETVFTGYYTPKILLVLAIASVYAVWITITSVWNAVKKPVQAPIALVLSKEENPKIWALAEDVARSLNAAPPDNIIAGLEPSFYATEIENVVDGKPLSGGTVFLSIPFCRILTPGELRGILGHELSHFTGEDVKYTTKFYPVYAGASGAVAVLGAQRAGLGTLGILPATAMFSFFLNVFAETEREIGRARELNADKESALRAAGAMDNAGALVKLHAYGPAFNAAYKAVSDGAASDKAEKNFGEIYENAVKSLTPDAAEENIKKGYGIQHPTDTHPQLSERLANLGVTENQIIGSALKIPAPQDSAAALIPQHEKIEEELTAVLNQIYINHFRALAEAQAKGKKKK